MLRLIRNEFVKSFNLIKLLIIITIMIIIAFTATESAYAPSNDKVLYSKSTSNADTLSRVEVEYNNNPTNDNLYQVYLYKLNVELEDVQNNLKIYSDTWQTNLISKIREIHGNIASLQMINDGIDASSFKYGSNYLNYSKEEISSLLNDLLTKRSKDIELLENGFYYDYELIEINDLKNEIATQKNDSTYSEDYTNYTIRFDNELIKIKQYIVDHKIKDDMNERVVAQKKLEELVAFKSNGVTAMSKEDFDSDYSLKSEYKTYDAYVSFIKGKENRYNEDYDRFWYAMENGIELTNRSKEIINNFWQLSFFVSVATIICYAGIVSSEYHSGSIRLLLTQGVKRRKILLSKFLTMALSTYGLYLLFLIIYTLLTLRKGSIDDLFVSQLITFNGNPMMINYLLYLFIQVLIYGLPSIFIMTFIFMLSTIKKGAILATSISIVLAASSFLQITNALFISTFKWYFMKYLPISYLSFAIPNYQYNYNYENIEYYILNQNLGIIVLLISIIVMYVITHIIFVKRDVRN